MDLGERIKRMDSWLLDEVCQPLADKLPERLTAFEVGMSCQLGSLLLSAVSIIAVFIVTGMNDFGNMIFNVLVWALCVTFFIGLSRLRVLVQPGKANPLRYMLISVRIISIPFTFYVIYQAITSPVTFSSAMWFNAFSNIVFVVGLYFISCQPRPPQRRAKEEIWGRVIAPEGSGL
ncbi:hypothetical protein [Acetobacter oryzifermentans]|uniref:Uncharacterized protein n=1 Tax=Acetobacter oryzifermentans TaxID=1633874 RepID=A0ABN4NNF7_9PROT|nr:hypothetical protein [Acetobacter oryzifermentans]ANA13440.1 hypothetical protein WG31_04985 [Acetobacter oryzifermentans]